MSDKQEEKIREVEEKVEKTNERISVLVGAGIVLVPAMVVGLGWLPAIVLAGAGGGLGSAAHHLRKWWVKRRKRAKRWH